ncbi:hypothetical protein AZE42_10746 [Rhizopogon vesiculosus]|uniref:Uncharacterized protein n=1 Tax=Rhizopogon vesiculosus TaxID=180088 RepID=A0A1J8PXY7_9AGAM|nr:hypothetical protein AZE42_10746 [Rhizopogon vesiculosus]
MKFIPSESASDHRLIQTPESRHLTLDLIACNWHTKFACASRTLPDEVREYHPRCSNILIGPFAKASAGIFKAQMVREHCGKMEA